MLTQYVWAGRAGGYVDELIQLAHNADPLDPAEQDCEQFYYALQNANFNVLGLITETGEVVERYEYTPYGQRTVYTTAGSADPAAHTPTLMSQRVELAGVAQPYALNPMGHQGLMHDEASNLIYNRARMLHPRLGRFLQRDPLGYVDGMSVYQYARGNPRMWLDPTGLFCEHKCDVEGERRQAGAVKVVIKAASTRSNPDTVNTANQLIWSTTGQDYLHKKLGDTAGTADMLGAVAGDMARGGKGAGSLSGVAGGHATAAMADAAKAQGVELQRLANGLSDKLMKRNGVVIWVQVAFLECRMEQCCVFWTRRNWQRKKEWVRTDQGTGNAPSLNGSKRGFAHTETGAIKQAIPRAEREAEEKVRNNR